MQIGQSAHDRFVHLLVVLETETRIFFGKLVQRLRELLLLTFVRRFHREPEHRLRKIQRLEMDLILVVRIVQDRVEMDFLDFRDRRDIARNRLIDLDVILAFQLEQMSDLERLFAVVDE